MLNIINKTLLSVTDSKVVVAIGLVIGLTLCANITIPFFPIPFTLQTMMIMLMVLYDRKIAFPVTVFYLGLSCLGLPVLANFSNGLSLLLSPTAGYLGGFVIATFFVSRLKHLSNLAGIILVEVIIFACGIAYLSKFVGMKQALYSGGIVFILPELLKGLIAYKLKHLISANN